MFVLLELLLDLLIVLEVQVVISEGNGLVLALIHVLSRLDHLLSAILIFDL